MPFSAGRADVSWSTLALLAGLSVLSWLSIYAGLMELIAASSGGDGGADARAAVAFAALMLQLMIVCVLDALFSRSLRWWLRPLLFLGYALLLTAGVGFGFAFYWKHLEGDRVTVSAAAAQSHDVWQIQQLGARRLDQLLTAFTTLESISAARAVKERKSGGTCGGGRGGKGPRQRLRESDARRFRSARAHVGRHVAKMDAELALLGAGLREMAGGAPATTAALAATGARGKKLPGLEHRLGPIAERYDALRRDPQLLRLRDTLRERAAQTMFSEARGRAFHCPDRQLQTALLGAVRAIGNLPELHLPVLASAEGSTAVSAAFRRLTTSGFDAWHRIMTDAQAILARTGILPAPRPAPAVVGGLDERDYIPLLIAVLVNFSLSLVSVNRPVGRLFDVLIRVDRVPESRLVELLRPGYRIFARNFDPAFQPNAAEVVSPLVDVVFGHRGKYYAAVPVDFGAQRDPSWVHAAADRARQRGEMFVYTPVPRGAVERSRYISSALVVLQGQLLVTPLRKRRVLSDDVVRRKLERQASLHAQADSFRVYAFAPGVWEEVLESTVGSSDGAGQRANQSHGAHPAQAPEAEAGILRPFEKTKVWNAPEADAVLAPRNAFRPFPAIAAAIHGNAALSAPSFTTHAADGSVDFDPGEAFYGTLKFNRGGCDPT